MNNALLFVLTFFGASLCLGAEVYPNRPVRVIVASASGSSSDLIARVISQQLSEQLGKQVVIDNRGGANGIVAAELTARAPSDGYTLLFGGISLLAINVSIHGSKLSYNPLKDFEPISLITKLPLVLSVHPSLPVRDMKQLIALVKANPDTQSYATGGNGSINHLVGELFKTATGIQLTHIPYQGSGPAAVALFSGEVKIMFSGSPVVTTHLKSGRLRALAVSSATRSPALPDVPTMMESGLPGFEAVSWFCLIAPARTPRPVIDKVRTALIRALEAPEVRQRLLGEGSTPEFSTPEELGEFMRSEIAKWEKAVKISGTKLN